MSLSSSAPVRVARSYRGGCIRPFSSSHGSAPAFVSKPLGFASACEPSFHLDLCGHRFIRFCEGAYPRYGVSPSVPRTRRYTETSPRTVHEVARRPEDLGSGATCECLRSRPSDGAFLGRSAPLVSTWSRRLPRSCGQSSASPSSAWFHSRVGDRRLLAEDSLLHA